MVSASAFQTCLKVLSATESKKKKVSARNSRCSTPFSTTACTLWRWCGYQALSFLPLKTAMESQNPGERSGHFLVDNNNPTEHLLARILNIQFVGTIIIITCLITSRWSFYIRCSHLHTSNFHQSQSSWPSAWSGVSHLLVTAASLCCDRPWKPGAVPCSEGTALGPWKGSQNSLQICPLSWRSSTQCPRQWGQSSWAHLPPRSYRKLEKYSTTLTWIINTCTLKIPLFFKASKCIQVVHIFNVGWGVVGGSRLNLGSLHMIYLYQYCMQGGSAEKKPVKKKFIDSCGIPDSTLTAIYFLKCLLCF